MSVRSSVMCWAMTLRNCDFEGMSRPFVGSSISSRRVPAARANDMNTFFFCPIESAFSLMSVVSSKSLRQASSTSRENRG